MKGGEDMKKEIGLRYVIEKKPLTRQRKRS